MSKFVEEYGLQKANVIDVGACDINGTYRDLFTGGKYVGADLQPGPNVDVIVGSKEWKALKKADVIISGQALEHVENSHDFMTTIYDAVKPGGLVCIIAPSAGPSHLPYRSPEPTEVWSGTWNGHWNVTRMSVAVELAGFEIIRCTINPGSEWQDCVCVARRPDDNK